MLCQPTISESSDLRLLWRSGRWTRSTGKRSWSVAMKSLVQNTLFKGLASQCKAQEKYKERLDSGVTWLKWLPTGMESKTRLAPKSNKVNSHKLTLNWNTSLYYRVVWKWRQSAFHANNHAIGGGSNGIIIHLCLNPGFGLQLLSINFVGFGSQHGLRFHTSRQSFEPSYTQIQALLVFLWAYVAKLYPRRIGWTSLGGC